MALAEHGHFGNNKKSFPRMSNFRNVDSYGT